MDKIGSIMAVKNFDEPPEIQHIKKYMHDTFAVDVSVIINSHSIVVVVGSAALAGSLRPRLLELQKISQTDKKIIIRIKL